MVSCRSWAADRAVVASSDGGAGGGGGWLVAVATLLLTRSVVFGFSLTVSMSLMSMVSGFGFSSISIGAAVSGDSLTLSSKTGFGSSVSVPGWCSFCSLAAVC